MINAINVSHYIQDEYYRLSGKDIDEMKLHKLLYFAQRESLAINNKTLFNELFEGWIYGPVCLEVRNDFRNTEQNHGYNENIPLHVKHLTDNIVDQYGSLESWKLSEISHNEISWKNARKGLSPDEKGSVPLIVDDIRLDAKKVRPFDSVWGMYLDEFDDYEGNSDR